MADDARISTALPNHPKTVKLCRRLGDAGGWSLVCLFLYAAGSRYDGNLTGMSDEDIEIAARWNGTPGSFVGAMVEVRFLDGEEGVRSIHDWVEWNPFAASKPIRSAAAKEANRIRWGRKRNAGRIRSASESDHGRTKAESPSSSSSSSTQENLKTSCTEPPQNGGSVQQQPLAGTLPLNDNSEYPILKTDEAQWQELYPGIDVRQELRSMKGWLLANPTRRKTKSGIKKFINNWLSKAQNEARGTGHGNTEAERIINRAEEAHRIARALDSRTIDASG